MENNNQRRKSVIKIDNSRRKLLINAVYNKMWSITHAAKDLGIPYENARKIIQAFEKEGRTDALKTGKNGNRKLTDGILEYLEGLVEERPDISLFELKTKVSENFGINVSQQTVSNGLYKLGITRKKMEVIIESVNSERSKIARRNFARDFLDHHPNDALNIFIDESGFNLHLRKTFGRSKSGVSAVQTVPTVRGRNISLICAITENEVLYSFCKIGSVKTQDFQEFLNVLINVCNRKGLIGYTLFFDNASIHRASLISNYLNEKEINYKFLSPYSYMLNPIEYSFSKIKLGVRRRLSEFSTGELITLIYESVNDITSEDLRGYYRHVRRNYTSAIAYENFD